MNNITQFLSNLYYWVINNLGLILFYGSILQLIGIIRFYKINIYSLGHIIYFPTFLLLCYLVFILIVSFIFGKESSVYIMLFTPLILPLIYVYISIMIFIGKWTLHYISFRKQGRKYGLDWIVSMQPVKKQNKNKQWLEKGIKQTGIKEETYNNIENLFNRDIKTNSDFINRNKDKENWN